jgi:hypothetical protein
LSNESKLRLLVVTTTCEIVRLVDAQFTRLALIVIVCCSKIIFIYIWLEGQVAEQKAMIQAMCTLLYPNSKPRLWRVLSSTNDTLAKWNAFLTNAVANAHDGAIQGQPIVPPMPPAPRFPPASGQPAPGLWQTQDAPVTIRTIRSDISCAGAPMSTIR